MNDQNNNRPRGKSPLLSLFDKFALFIVLLIIGFFLSQKMGCPVAEVEEKVEWVD